MNFTRLEQSTTAQEQTETRAPYTTPKLEEHSVWIEVVGTTMQIGSLESLGDAGE